MTYTVADFEDAIRFCDKCGTDEEVLQVKKDGPNKGKFFIRCKCKGSFAWLSIEENGRNGRDVSDYPGCPKCGEEMRRRERRSDGRPFLGCSMWPDCNGTRGFAEGDGYDDAEVPQSKVRVERVIPLSFVPSKYQQAVFDWVTEGSGKSLVVEALAGSGKTTTGVEMLNLIPRSKAVLFVAFNTHVAKELGKRAPKHVEVRTYHSLGFAACNKMWSNIKVDNKKIYQILESVLDKNTHGNLFPVIKNIVSLVKANLIDPTDEELNNLTDHHGIELNGGSAIIYDAVRIAIGKSAEMTNVVDYDDMCWLPVYHNLPVRKYDFLFIDEAQDTNKNQMALALMSIKDSGRIVAVGDRYQSLYGFRGADINAIPNLIESLDADTLPLSITYRNPKCVVEHCNGLFPGIPLEAYDGARTGQIRTVTSATALLEYKAGDMVLCRVNAPLVAPAFALIRNGVKAVIRGRNIGENLLNMIKKVKADNLIDLLNYLSVYKDKELSKLLAARKNNQAQALEDKVDTIIALSDGVETIFELKNRIKSVFSDDVEGVVFSSVHRAKGLESERVFILHPELMPHSMAKKDWEMVQERNIEYVAITRTLDQLIYVR